MIAVKRGLELYRSRLRMAHSIVTRSVSEDGVTTKLNPREHPIHETDVCVCHAPTDDSKDQAAAVGRIAIVWITFSATALGQQPPYDVFPPADPPYYRVRYEASTRPGELIYPVNYTIWIPKDVKSLRGVIVHQHGCGEGSCKSGLTGAYDLHWQALAKKHDCALLAPVVRATGQGRLPDVVRSAQRLRRRVSEVPGRSRREVRPSGVAEGAVGAVGTQRRRSLGRRHGAAASGTCRRRVAAFRRAAAEGRSGATHDQGPHAARRRAEGAGDVQSGHEGRRDGQGRSLRRRVAGE